MKKEEDGTLVLEGAGDVFQFLQVYYGLQIQRDTGLRHSRGSLIKLAQRRYGVQSRTAAGAVRELEVIKLQIEAAR